LPTSLAFSAPFAVKNSSPPDYEGQIDGKSPGQPYSAIHNPQSAIILRLALALFTF
jgi:hypothetical protein